MHDRNRALNSDVVCVKLKKEDEWKVNDNLNVIIIFHEYFCQ